VDAHLSASGQRLAGRRIPPRRRGDRRTGAHGALMPAVVVLAAQDARVVEQYLSAMRQVGRRTGRSTTQAARTFQTRLAGSGGWNGLSGAQQLDAVSKARSFASWLMVTGRIRADAALISGLNLHLGNAARLFCPAAQTWFVDAGAALRTRDWDIALQWNTLAKITAMTGVSPDEVGDEEFVAARAALLAAYRDRGLHSSGRNLA